ncbi:MAG: Bug family tripartite tricarboxylate transporter substrate binding protein [bacterium]|jgi:tripartite-type tricarboxylate transporter receptor subunit TctC|nr:tripartite tricarboxylate transporter substrate binding protein [Betaproteobacteria bacterium]
MNVSRLPAPLLVAAILSPLLAGEPGLALAQPAWPAKPIRLIVPFGAGGASDFVARVIGPRIADQLGQPVVIENRAGANGNVGMEFVARSTPDGYTTFLGNIGAIAINPHVYGAALKVDPMKDLAPVGLVSETTTMLLVHPSLPVRSSKELVAFIRARPGQVNYASAGSGSLSHLQMELLAAQNGLKMVHIPYKGGAGQAVTDVVAGHVTVTIQTLTSVMSFAQSGKLRPIALTTAKRLEQFPKVPTLREEGMDIVSTSWQGILVPAGTPAEPIRRLHAAINQSLPVPEVRERFATGATDVLLSASPQEFADYIRAESARWGKVVREAGIKLE